MEVLASGDSVPIPASAVDVTEAAQLERVRSVVSAVSELAVDVEADSMHHFRARLCFVQLGTDHDIFLLDTLVPGVSPGALQDVFGNPAITKFFHAAQGDLQYLAEQGVRVRGLFDTHRAATLLNWPKVGLVDLVREKLSATLKKEHQQADFSRRPLPPELREYIADDVRYLCEVGRWVREACETAGILEEVQLDCDRMCDEAQARPDPVADFQPKLQRQGLSKEQFAVAWHSAHALHKKRMEWAEAEDVPMGRMLSNMALSALSTKHPTDLRHMAKLEGVRGAFVRAHGDEVMALLAKVVTDVQSGALPMPDEKRDRDPKRKKREEALMEWRKKTATERKVAPSVVLPNSLVADLSVNPPESVEALAKYPYFGTKRAGLYAEAVVGLLTTLR
ncbi:MAG: ribonuclease D [Archangium gephyra]|uniref:Ribonuclease D n=1 Tax=Archangium gephyra TaxID=48 RepID=A0A2W5TJD9_9BACT|nr:MAG: ribonuclease D [Archangium gephyra]